MGLSKARYEIGTTHYSYERVAVQLLVDGLPDRAPYHLFALKDLVTADGRRYEIDAVVVTPRAVFLVEIKSHPAHFKGDSVDWRVEWKDGRLPSFIENPVRLTNAKARVLASALDRKLSAADRPYVQPLVFLSDERASVDSNPRRALALCHGVLSGERDGLTEAQLRDTVLARYPEAEALPARPELDALVAEALRMDWDDAGARWRRPQAGGAPSSSLRSEAPPVVQPTVLPDARPARRSPEQQEAWEFDDALKIAARRGDLRVFTVAPSAATAVAARVAERLGTKAQSLDAALLAEVDALMVRKKIKPEVVVAADREGPAGRHWLTLRKLVSEAADTLAARWTKEREPLVLGDLGLAARFNLGGLLQSLLDTTRRDDGRAVFVVIPRFGEGASASVDGGALPALPVPVFSPGQCMEVPRAWVENRHRGAD